MCIVNLNSFKYFFKKGMNSHSIAKVVPELLEFQGKNLFWTLIKIESLMMMRHTNFSFIVGYL